MTYNAFIDKLLHEKLIKKENIGFGQIEKTLKRARKDLDTARLILDKDEALAYTAAYDAMLRAGRAYMFIKGLRPTAKYQHRTVVDFVTFSFSSKYRSLMQLFDVMRKKRNKFLYEAMDISKHEAKNAIVHAEELLSLIIQAIKKENPQKEFNF